MKKRPSLLLEVLLAMSLLALCATALIRQPILFHRAEVEQLERVASDRIAAWTYTEICQKLIKGEFSWSQIPTVKGKSKKFTLPDTLFRVPSLFSRSATRSYFLETLREKQSEDGRITRLVSVHIQIGSGRKKRQFSYQLNLVRQLQKAVLAQEPDITAVQSLE